MHDFTVPKVTPSASDNLRYAYATQRWLSKRHLLDTMQCSFLTFTYIILMLIEFIRVRRCSS